MPRLDGGPVGHGITRSVAHRAVAHRAAGEPRIVRIVEPPALTVPEDLELILHPRSPFELDRQIPDVGAGDRVELEIIRPWVDPMAQVKRIRYRTSCKGAEIALNHGKGVLSEEGRYRRPPFPLILKRRTRRTQLVDCQNAVAGHRVTLSTIIFLNCELSLNSDALRQAQGAWRQAQGA